jgi:hypothetical protein
MKRRVYFVQRGHCGPIKIGWSTSPHKRFGQHCSAHPDDELRLIIVLPLGVTELEIHRRFSSCRLPGDGEWFAPAQELVDFINATFLHETGISLEYRLAAECFARPMCDPLCEDRRKPL